MSAQDLIMGARVAHIRELKTEIAKLSAENAALRAERDTLQAHFDFALIAAHDLQEGETLEIWDGWNLILGAQKEASDRASLIARAKESGKRIWIVFDGHDENVTLDGSVRISYTGGKGEHRADKVICDYVRMAAYLGRAQQIVVRTNDKDFKKQVRRLGGIA